jgi:hypothetical protein
LTWEEVEEVEDVYCLVELEMVIRLSFIIRLAANGADLGVAFTVELVKKEYGVGDFFGAGRE